jgi:hypothetical protein
VIRTGRHRKQIFPNCSSVGVDDHASQRALTRVDTQLGIIGGAERPFAVKDAHDRDAVDRDAKVNHMPLDTTATVPFTNMSQVGADFGDSANTWNAAVNKSVYRSA